jgi:hypothetical protein
MCSSENVLVTISLLVTFLKNAVLLVFRCFFRPYSKNPARLAQRWMMTFPQFFILKHSEAPVLGRSAQSVMYCQSVLGDPSQGRGLLTVANTNALFLVF